MINGIKIFLNDLKVYWRTLVIILTPIVLSPLIFLVTGEEKFPARCGYTIIVMAVYWITESLPLPVTALLPLVFYPLLGVMGGKAVAKLYMQDTTMVFLAGLMMALAIEKVELHKRFGTGILLKVGATPTRILIGFMFPAWFLSMWISNTATTSMMIPAAEAVAGQLRLGMKRSKFLKSQKIKSNEETADEIVDVFSGNSNPAYLHDDVWVTKFTEESKDENFSISSKLGQDVFSHYYSFENDKHDIPTVEITEPNGISHCPNGDVKDQDCDTAITNRLKTQQLNTTSTRSLTTAEEIQAVVLDEAEEKKLTNLSRMLCLAVAYSANIGGTATLTGSPTNLLVSEAVDKAYRSHDVPSPLTYASWLFFGFPHSFICLLVLWLWLQFYYLGWRSFMCKKDEDFISQEKSLKQIMEKEYKKLGSIKFGEVATAVFLVIMVILWLTRAPGFMPGYDSLFRDGYVTDATPAIFIVVILFAFPSEKPNWMCFRNKNEKAKSVPSLLNWNLVSTKLPWGPMFLLGGGFAMAEGCEVSGLSALVGKQLGGLAALETWVVSLVVTVIVSFITEIMSNTAIMALFLPILEALANDLNVNPLYFMLPAGMAASYAFMLPIATPPNAIVFSFGHLKVIDMIKVGFIMNCLCVLVVTMGTNTWGMAMFQLDQVPWTSGNTNTTNTTTSNIYK